MTFSFDALRRWPDIEGPDQLAVDAADRLILDESAAARADLPRTDIAVIGDGYGAMALGAADAGTDGVVRVHQDSLLGERALAANAERTGLTDAVASVPLSPELLRGARVVLLRLPKSLDELRDIAGAIAAHAAPDVVVFAGGRLKHMSVGMNAVLGENFSRLDITHARQKSRVLIAQGPRNGRDPEPRRATHDGLVVCGFGGVFAGTSIDIGTRFLLEHLPETIPAEGRVVDLACGSGVVAAWLARRHPELSVYASDPSAVAVASARATAAANEAGDRITVVRDDALSALPDSSASFIALNPPFHSGTAIDTRLAAHLFADAARALRPGRELWTVWNSALRYRGELERIVGPTRQIARNGKFTVTASVAR
ncbi:methyltransferase [Microbacterium sp. cx-59]|uniref:class I SAM-dependent methyltransferase n=1 Tax=Microbacterium sp. cx-59 TaxID=2891207 RepID=UPI001E5ADFBB|nr:methyltransferase [Microbacterium sp. cx-59]MCC4906702.1 methyltransferase [Microbacterium sp. cx-59]